MLVINHALPDMVMHFFGIVNSFLHIRGLVYYCFPGYCFKLPSCKLYFR